MLYTLSSEQELRHTTSVYGRIPILKSTGTGASSLAAFHAALVALELGHYNLIRLSSVVPPDTTVDGSGVATAPSGSWGDRLYCVYAEQRATVIGEEAWSGVGWVQRLDNSGGGLLVEHEGHSEASVTDAILTSLHDMRRSLPGRSSEPSYVVNGIRCTDQPVCSLVIAPFQTAPWHQ